MIILNDDYENDIFEFYFISKGIEYTFNDENLFMNLVERIKGKLSESNYYVFDNDNCDYGEVERSEGDQGNSVRNDILRFLEWGMEKFMSRENYTRCGIYFSIVYF